MSRPNNDGIGKMGCGAGGGSKTVSTNDVVKLWSRRSTVTTRVSIRPPTPELGLPRGNRRMSTARSMSRWASMGARIVRSAPVSTRSRTSRLCPSAGKTNTASNTGLRRPPL